MDKARIKNIVREVLKEIKVNRPSGITPQMIYDKYKKSDSIGYEKFLNILEDYGFVKEDGEDIRYFLKSLNQEELNELYFKLSKIQEIKINKPNNFLPFEAIKPGMVGEDYGNQNVVIIAKGTWDELEHLNTSQASLDDYEDDEREEIGKECVAVVFIEDYDFEYKDYNSNDVIVYVYGSEGVLVERDWKKLIPKEKR